MPNPGGKEISGDLLHKKNDLPHVREGRIHLLHKMDEFAHKNEKWPAYA